MGRYAPLDEAEVSSIKRMLCEGHSQSETAHRHGVSQAIVNRIAQGYSHGNIPWPDGSTGKMPGWAKRIQAKVQQDARVSPKEGWGGKSPEYWRQLEDMAAEVASAEIRKYHGHEEQPDNDTPVTREELFTDTPDPEPEEERPIPSWEAVMALMGDRDFVKKIEKEENEEYKKAVRLTLHRTTACVQWPDQVWAKLLPTVAASEEARKIDTSDEKSVASGS